MLKCLRKKNQRRKEKESLAIDCRGQHTGWSMVCKCPPCVSDMCTIVLHGHTYAYRLPLFFDQFNRFLLARI